MSLSDIYREVEKSCKHTSGTFQPTARRGQTNTSGLLPDKSSTPRPATISLIWHDGGYGSCKVHVAAVL